jgi:hypothetical protein
MTAMDRQHDAEGWKPTGRPAVSAARPAAYAPRARPRRAPSGASVMRVPYCLSAERVTAAVRSRHSSRAFDQPRRAAAGSVAVPWSTSTARHVPFGVDGGSSSGKTTVAERAGRAAGTDTSRC